LRLFASLTVCGLILADRAFFLCFLLITDGCCVVWELLVLVVCHPTTAAVGRVGESDGWCETTMPSRVFVLFHYRSGSYYCFKKNMCTRD
jgi:hypothetical protein